MNQTFGPYSPIRRHGDMIFVSGQVGVDPITKTAKSDITSQTRQVLENIAALLGAEHTTLNSIVKTTIYITDMNLFDLMNREYEKYFKAPRPARSTVGVKDLPHVVKGVNLLVEIEAIAVWEKI